jgi:hypothetical protein
VSATGHRREESVVTRYEEYDRPRRRGRRLGVLVIVVIVLVGLLLGADFLGRKYAENRVAAQIQKQGFPTRPSVTIDGFPFLTQLVSRDFSEVQIAAGSITEGPLQIHSIDATLHRVLVNSSYSGGRVTQLNGSADVTFAALASAMTSEAGVLSRVINGMLTLSAAGSDEVQATLSVAGLSETATWRVTVPDPHEISVQLVSGGGVLPSSVLSGIGTITINIPGLPMGLGLASISATPSGLVASVTGHNVSFGS